MGDPIQSWSFKRAVCAGNVMGVCGLWLVFQGIRSDEIPSERREELYRQGPGAFQLHEEQKRTSQQRRTRGNNQGGSRETRSMERTENGGSGQCWGQWSGGCGHTRWIGEKNAGEVVDTGIVDNSVELCAKGSRV